MRSDFERWLEYHGGAYPSFIAWIAENENRSHAEHMRRLLGHYTYEQLVAATDALFAAESQPRGFSNHARSIRQHIANDVHKDEHDGPQINGDHLTAYCPRCMDYGIVEVVAPITLRAMRSGKEDGTIKTCVVACDCSRGANKSSRMKLPRWEDGHTLIRYEDVLDLAISQRAAEWDVAKNLMDELEQNRRTPQTLSADILP